jgi:hypothetical protein
MDAEPSNPLDEEIAQAQLFHLAKDQGDVTVVSNCKSPSIIKSMRCPANIRSGSIAYDGHRTLTTHDASVDVVRTIQGTPTTVSGPVQSRLH